MPSLDLGSVVGQQGEQGATGAQGIRGEQGLPGPNQVTNSTATPLTGVLTGNGSVVGVANIDAAPIEDSTGFAQSGGTYNAIKARMPVNGMGKNLLDNWYFLNPVNQRGQSSYGGVGYTIDRWRIENSTPSLNIVSNGVTFGSELVGGQFLQKIEPYKLVDGETYTLSALCTLTSGSATIKLAGVDSPYPDFGVATVTTGLTSVTFTLNRGSYSGSIKAFIRNESANGSVIVHAIKLELGSEQTLCHNEGTDANPVWVLNEIPDYGEELAKCQRYLCVLNANGASYGTVAIGMAYSSTSVEVLAFLPVTMGPGTVTLSYTGPWQTIDTAQGGQKLSVTNIGINSAAFYSGNTVVLSVEVSDATPGKVYNLRAYNNTSARIFISAEL